MDFSVESVNDPPGSQNIFDRKGSRGPSDFDIRNNFVANAGYDLPAHGRLLGGWQVSAVVSVHSGLPCTPVLAFDNADIQSRIIPERPDLVGNPDTGVCPNGAKAGTVSCWFNPSAFAVPTPGEFGNAGRNILRGPGFAQFDPAIHKKFAITERGKMTVGVELITCSTTRILVFRVIRKIRSSWEVTAMPSSRTRRVISPLTQAKSSPPPALRARFSWSAGLRSEQRRKAGDVTLPFLPE